MATRSRRVRIKKHRGKWLASFKSRKPGQKYEYKTFDLKKQAEDFKAEMEQGFKEGTTGLSRDSITVEAAAAMWLASPSQQKKERSTRDAYEQQLRNHVVPFFGDTLLTDIDGPMVTELEHWLETEPHGPRNQPCSSAMAGKVMVTFRSLLGYMQRRGFVGRNIAREFMEPQSSNGRIKLEVGRDIPTIEEIRSIRTVLDSIGGRWRPFILTAIFTGLRASELRGLRWQDVDLDGKVLHVRQRADRFNAIGPPKSGAGTRSVPLPPLVVSALREWRLQSPKCDPATLAEAGDHLVFPSRHGGIESHTICLRDGFGSIQRAAGMMVETGRFDRKGQPIKEPKYGLHALRHWYASWCLNRVEDGGLALEAHSVMRRLGHSKISMTIEVYGHLFPSKNDDTALEEAERRLFA